MSSTDIARERKELLETILELAKQERNLLIAEKSGPNGEAPVIDRERPILQVIAQIEAHFYKGPSATTRDTLRAVAKRRADGQSWMEIQDEMLMDVSNLQKRDRLKSIYDFQEYIARFWKR